MECKLQQGILKSGSRGLCVFLLHPDIRQAAEGPELGQGAWQWLTVLQLSCMCLLASTSLTLKPYHIILAAS